MVDGCVSVRWCVRLVRREEGDVSSEVSCAWVCFAGFHLALPRVRSWIRYGCEGTILSSFLSLVGAINSEERSESKH